MAQTLSELKLAWLSRVLDVTISSNNKSAVLDAAALQRAMNGLLPEIKRALHTRPDLKDELERPWTAFQAHLKSGDLEAAAEALEETRRVIAATVRAHADGTEGVASNGQTEGKVAGIEAALAQWQAKRTEAVTQLKALENAVRAMRHPKGDSAIILLSAIQKNLTPRPSALRDVDELTRYLRDDDIIKDAETPNGFGIHIDIRQPLLQALTDLRAAMA